MAQSSAISGVKMKFQVSLDGGVNYSDITEQNDISLDITPITDDATNKTTSVDLSGTVWREPVVVALEWSGQANCNNLQDVVQNGIRSAAIAGTRLWIKCFPEVGSGKEVYTGLAIFGVQLSGPNTNLQRGVYNLTGSGPLTRSAQS